MALANSASLAGLALLVVHYNTPAQTLRCLASADAFGVGALFLLDNASTPENRRRLEAGLACGPLARVSYLASAQNLGFAQGCNVLIAKALALPEVSAVFLLNSDAWLNPDALPAFEAVVSLHPDMLAARMHLPPSGATDTAMVESLGLCCYRSLLLSNRKRLQDPCFGPTGGCAVFSRRLLEALEAQHGHVFDPDYFCYAEDADLALRARLLGYVPQYLDVALAWHEGQASGQGRDFIVYHGMRNSVYTQIKSFPFAVLWRAFPWLCLMHIGLALHLLLQGKLRLLWRIYRDVLKALPALLKKRRTVQNTARLPGKALWALQSRAFYDPEYLRRLWPFSRKPH